MFGFCEGCELSMYTSRSFSLTCTGSSCSHWQWIVKTLWWPHFAVCFVDVNLDVRSFFSPRNRLFDVGEPFRQSGNLSCRIHQFRLSSSSCRRTARVQHRCLPFLLAHLMFWTSGWFGIHGSHRLISDLLLARSTRDFILLLLMSRCFTVCVTVGAFSTQILNSTNYVIVNAAATERLIIIATRTSASIIIIFALTL